MGMVGRREKVGDIEKEALGRKGSWGRWGATVPCCSEMRGRDGCGVGDGLGGKGVLD